MTKKTQTNLFGYIGIALLCVTGLFLMGFEFDWAWGFWFAGITSLLMAPRKVAKDLVLLYISIGLLGLMEINTEVSWDRLFEMGTMFGLVLLLPYLIARFIYREPIIQFHWRGKKWSKTQIGYILLAGFLAYLIIPFYLKHTGAYLNWPPEGDWGSMGRLFIGTNGLGIWDELFFVNTVLAIFRRHLPFAWANLAQSILFTSFLHDLGFTGWGFVPIFIFALLQGLTFKNTKSLLYLITIHLVVDFVLFLALMNSHHLALFNVFVT